MAPLFSKVDSNKLLRDVQHEENMTYAQFGKDLFNISKVIGRKKVAQFFFDSQCIIHIYNFCKHHTEYLLHDWLYCILASVFCSTN